MNGNVAGLSDLIKKPAPPAGSAAAPIKTSDEKTADDKLGEKIHAIDLGKKEGEAQEMAAKFKLRYMDLRKFPIPPEALQLIPEDMSRKYSVLPFFSEGQDVRIGVVNIADPEVQKYLGSVAQEKKVKLVPYVITDESYQKGAQLYASLPKIVAITRDVTITQEDLDKFSALFDSLPELAAKMKEVNTTDFISLIFAAAFKMNASDIHVEAEESKIIVRLRLDGMLHEIGSVPHEMWKKIIGRIKLLAALKINKIGRVSCRERVYVLV
jgi:type IV pilus assembly protein PilB